MPDTHIFLSCFWILWCFLHSLLISPSATRFRRRLPPETNRYFRLAYNLFSLAGLLPLLFFTRLLERDIVFAWQGYWQVLRASLLIASLWLFHGGSLRYDMGLFLGLKQITTQESHALLAESNEICDKGVFALVRHPWYLGSLLFLWSVLPVYRDTTFLAAIILTVYLFVGTSLEERKLVNELGTKYRNYQNNVSMLFPWKWLRRFLARRKS